jgi:RNA polymerase sigma-70 factor (ECF subfamily)
MSSKHPDRWDWALLRQRCAAEAARILRRHHDAEEVVQEAMARAWRSRGSCRSPDAPLAWCLQITRNEAFRLISRQAGRAASEPLEATGEVADEHPIADPERAVTRVDIGRALQELSPHERALIALRYEEDCSHPQIARRLQVPEATVRVRLHRAHKRLESLLQDRL